MLIVINYYFFFENSKSFRKEIPIQTYQDLTSSEEHEITNDLEVCWNYWQ